MLFLLWPLYQLYLVKLVISPRPYVLLFGLVCYSEDIFYHAFCVFAAMVLVESDITEINEC